MNRPQLRDKLIAKGIPSEVADMALAKMETQGRGGAGGEKPVAENK